MRAWPCPGLLSQGIVADPAGKFLYVSDAVTDQVHVFSISASGGLSEISGSPYTVGTPGGLTSAPGMAMDSAGKFLYVTDLSNNDVAGFTVNSSTGALTAMNPATFATSTTPVQVVVDSSNKYVYVSDYNDVLGGVSAFSLDSTSGVLTPVGALRPSACHDQWRSDWPGDYRSICLRSGTELRRGCRRSLSSAGLEG